MTNNVLQCVAIVLMLHPWLDLAEPNQSCEEQVGNLKNIPKFQLAANIVNIFCALFIYAICLIFANQINKKNRQEPIFRLSFLSNN